MKFIKKLLTLQTVSNMKSYQKLFIFVNKKNENIFFEYNYAKGIDKQIILVKKANDTTKKPFDVEHNLRFEFDSHSQLEELLEEKIRQIIIQMGYIVNNEN